MLQNVTCWACFTHHLVRLTSLLCTIYWMWRQVGSHLYWVALGTRPSLSVPPSGLEKCAYLVHYLVSMHCLQDAWGVSSYQGHGRGRKQLKITSSYNFTTPCCSADWEQLRVEKRRWSADKNTTLSQWVCCASWKIRQWDRSIVCVWDWTFFWEGGAACFLEPMHTDCRMCLTSRECTKCIWNTPFPKTCWRSSILTSVYVKFSTQHSGSDSYGWGRAQEEEDRGGLGQCDWVCCTGRWA